MMSRARLPLTRDMLEGKIMRALRGSSLKPPFALQ